jgi:peptidoglycan/xylan/chitin deacetylase (PgdA/CDA1 family)
MLILTYHAISHDSSPLCVTADLFDQHLDVILSSGVRVVTVSQLPQLMREPEGERLVALTFDDGFASVGEHAAPSLSARALTATVFCVAGHLGGTNDWRSAPPAGFSAPLLSPAQVEGLARAGFEIGSHGFTHAPVRALARAELEREVRGSKVALEDLTGAPVSSFAYPYGAIPSGDGQALVGQLYTTACTTRVGRAGPKADLHQLPRVDAHYLRRPDRLLRALQGGLTPYLSVRRLGSSARRSLHKDYVTT